MEQVCDLSQSGQIKGRGQIRPATCFINEVLAQGPIHSHAGAATAELGNHMKATWPAIPQNSLTDPL